MTLHDITLYLGKRCSEINWNLTLLYDILDNFCSAAHAASTCLKSPLVYNLNDTINQWSASVLNNTKFLAKSIVLISKVIRKNGIFLATKRYIVNKLLK